MTVPQNTAWPGTLTNKAWQKKKSFLDKAKSKTKTGLGAELLKAEAAWKLIKFTVLDATKQPIPTAKEADNKKHAADTHLKTVVAAASNAIKNASLKAKATKTNTALSSTARQAAAAIETGLNNQRKLLKAINLSDFDSAKNTIVQLTFQTNLNTLKRGVEGADRFIQQVETNPTRDTFNKGVQAVTRPLLVALGNIGAVGNKPDPRPLGKPLEAWADGKELLEPIASPQMEKRVVTETIKFYKKTLLKIKQWAA